MGGLSETHPQCSCKGFNGLPGGSCGFAVLSKLEVILVPRSIQLMLLIIIAG